MKTRIALLLTLAFLAGCGDSTDKRTAAEKGDDRLLRYTREHVDQAREVVRFTQENEALERKRLEELGLERNPQR
ncbi:MAG: hypothetical protein KDG50_13385 [Chromatiales bacterium]|nr:hypothetical protein [Chromatiales bacterium]